MLRILEINSRGIVIFNAKGGISYLNDIARRDLGLKDDGLPTDVQFKRTGESFSDLEEFVVTARSRKHTLMGQMTPLAPSDYHFATVFTFESLPRMADRVSSLGDSLSGVENLIGRSPAMLQLKDQIRQIAGSTSTVLVTGESGTGKELVARAIHAASGRRDKPFIGINCGAIPESLMESELFGYEPGAFSGANSGGQKGLLEQAHTGTFFLDEVSEMPVSLQVKLLRVLQERVVRRVGGKVNHSVDIRIIAASNRNLRELVAQGAFREDLFFRLDVIPLFVPPLRERQGDIRLLVAHFLQSFSRERGCTYRVATELMHAFEAYPWPGNVRELKNFVEYGVGFCEHGVLTLDLMDSRFKTASPPPVKTEKGMPSPPPGPARDTAEYDRIMQLLGRYGQHTEGKKRTASELGISLATLYRRMGQLGITARKHAR